MWHKIPIGSVWLLASFPLSSTVTVMAQQAILSKYWLTADLDSISSTTESQDNSSINSDSSTESELLIKLGVMFFGLVVNSTLHYGISTYDKTPYHTSALTGEIWVLELLNGHPEHIRSELGVHKHVFWQIIKDLHQSGHQDYNTWGTALHFFGTLASPDSPYDMSANIFSMQRKRHPGM